MLVDDNREALQAAKDYGIKYLSFQSHLKFRG